MLVVLHHYFDGKAIPAPARQLLMTHGYLWVDLFFVLSGFVMAMTYGPKFESAFSTSAYFDFIYKRLGRVYPLYLMMTVVTFVFNGSHSAAPPANASGATLAANLLLVQAWGFAPSIDSPGWSISTEFGAYLLFPLFVIFLPKNRLTTALLAAVMAFVTLGVLSTLSTTQLHESINYRGGPLDIYGVATPLALIRCLAGFVLGMVAFRLVHHPQIQHFIARGVVADLTALAVLCAMAVPKTDVFAVLLFVVLVMSLAAEQGVAAKFLSTGGIYFLGVISYSIYLIHVPLQTLLRPSLTTALQRIHVPSPFAGLILMIPCLAVATVTYYCIEKPARKWTRRAAGMPQAPIVVEPSAP